MSGLSEELEKNGNDVSILCNAPLHSFFYLKYASNDAPLFKRFHRYGRILFKMVLVIAPLPGPNSIITLAAEKLISFSIFLAKYLELGVTVPDVL